MLRRLHAIAPLVGGSLVTASVMAEPRAASVGEADTGEAASSVGEADSGEAAASEAEPDEAAAGGATSATPPPAVVPVDPNWQAPQNRGASSNHASPGASAEVPSLWGGPHQEKWMRLSTELGIGKSDFDLSDEALVVLGGYVGVRTFPGLFPTVGLEAMGNGRYLGGPVFTGRLEYHLPILISTPPYFLVEGGYRWAKEKSHEGEVLMALRGPIFGLGGGFDILLSESSGVYLYFGVQARWYWSDEATVHSDNLSASEVSAFEEQRAGASLRTLGGLAWVLGG